LAQRASLAIQAKSSGAWPTGSAPQLFWSAANLASGALGLPQVGRGEGGHALEAFTRRAEASCAIIMANLFQFLQDVRTEADKVTWPTRRETLITSGLVIVLVIFTSLFFLVVDQALRLIVTFILSFGH
jgi:preprotein translocase subunit SecE